MYSIGVNSGIMDENMEAVTVVLIDILCITTRRYISLYPILINP